MGNISTGKKRFFQTRSGTEVETRPLGEGVSVKISDREYVFTTEEVDTLVRNLKNAAREADPWRYANWSDR